MDSVYFSKCDAYDLSAVEARLRSAFSALGVDVPGQFSNKTVLLKPNLLGAYQPEKGVTTHPIVLEAIIRIVSDVNCTIWLGDSPNGVQQSLEEVWNVTGMTALCDRYGVEKKFFEREGAIEKNGKIISKPILDADILINVPKFKTHGLTLLTAAVKNMFGAVPGLKKTAYHRECRSKEIFARCLVEIAEIRRPDFNILDGIESMGGNGPSGGYIVPLGLLAVTRDMHAIDYLLAKLLGVSPREVDMLDEAEKLGFVNLKDEPKVVGESLGSFDMTNFGLSVTARRNFRGSRWFQYCIRKLMSSMKILIRPEHHKCVKCGMCGRICPIDNITFENGYPVINNEKCIECYCCHEVCPENALELEESLPLRIVKKLSARNK